MRQVVLLVDDYTDTSYGILPYCRICHEAEFESSMSLEAPCACSGTVKFAHRDCIQRWCNEKGNTICEICLQNYEPGYRAPSKKVQLLESTTIRDSMEIPRRENEIEEVEELAVDEGVTVEAAYSNCTHVADRNASCRRFLALTNLVWMWIVFDLFRQLNGQLTLFLLLRDMFATCAGGTGDYPFTLLTILILRASGIVLPVYIVFWLLGACHKNIRGQCQNSGRNNEDPSEVPNVDEQLHLV